MCSLKLGQNIKFPVLYSYGLQQILCLLSLESIVADIYLLKFFSKLTDKKKNQKNPNKPKTTPTISQKQNLTLYLFTNHQTANTLQKNHTCT